MFYYIIKYTILELLFLLPVLVLYSYIFIFINIENKANSSNSDSFFSYIPIYALKVAVYALLVVATMWFSIVFKVKWRLLVSLFIFLLNIFSLICLLYMFVRRRIDFNIITNFFIIAFRFLIIELFVFIILTLLRGLSPELATTEKPMDYSFIANFLHQSVLPFKNPWLFGFLLNYYYLGQFFISIITYITALPPWISYNFAINLISVWAFMVLFEFLGMIYLLYQSGLSYNKINKRALIFIIVLGVSVILFGGNFYYLARIIADNINLIVGRRILNFAKFFYPDSTRVIPYTINEYPAYSILLGDLHGHFIALPFVYTFISIFIFLTHHNVILTKLNKKRIKSFSLKKFIKLIPIIFLLISVAIFIVASNSWDAINLITFAFVFLLLFWYQQHINKNYAATTSFFYLVLEYFIIALGGLIGILPFLKYFLPPTDGIGFKIHLDFKYYLPLFGHYFLLLFIILFIVKQSKMKFIELIKKTLPLSSLLLTSILLILGTQFFYIKDVFYKTNAPYYRANTVFKVYYTAWSFLGIALVSFFILLLFNYRISKRIKRFAIQFYVLLGSLLISYFIIGSIQRFRILDLSYVKQRFRKVASLQYLDGLSSTNFFDESQIKVVRRLFYDNSGAVIVEPIDYKSYSDTAKFCIYSGQFCFLGWPMHNMQWYGGFKGNGITWYYSKSRYSRSNVDIQKRVRLIQALYENKNLSLFYDYPNMKNFHIFVYNKPPIVINPNITANRILIKLADNKKFSCSMTFISKVYDIYCKKSE